MSLHTWLTFAVVAVCVSVVPGPAVVAVVTSALRGGFRSSLAANAGVLAGDAAFVAAAAAGLGALLIASHPLFVAVKWLGIAYLAYLGVRALIDRGTVYALDAPGRERRAFRLGLTTQLANPKVILFFGALLPQFVDASHPAASQFALLGATFIVSDALVFAAYGALAHRARVLLRTRRAARLTSRVTGAVMIGAAARLAAER
jgi:threonine/homoserine/homoserine lactone efflux protein